MPLEIKVFKKDVEILKICGVTDRQLIGDLVLELDNAKELAFNVQKQHEEPLEFVVNP